MKVQLDPGAWMPDRAHNHDAGADLRTPERFPDGYVGMVKSKSGLMCNDGIVTDGVCDAGYSGSVRVCLFNHSNKHRVFEKGEKIAQIIFLPVITPDFEQVEKITGGERSDNGFGSTGRF